MDRKYDKIIKKKDFPQNGEYQQNKIYKMAQKIGFEFNDDIKNNHLNNNKNIYIKEGKANYPNRAKEQINEQSQKYFGKTIKRDNQNENQKKMLGQKICYIMIRGDMSKKTDDNNQEGDLFMNFNSFKWNNIYKKNNRNDYKKEEEQSEEEMEMEEEEKEGEDNEENEYEEDDDIGKEEEELEDYEEEEEFEEIEEEKLEKIEEEEDEDKNIEEMKSEKEKKIQKQIEPKKEKEKLIKINNQIDKNEQKRKDNFEENRNYVKNIEPNQNNIKKIEENKNIIKNDAIKIIEYKEEPPISKNEKLNPPKKDSINENSFIPQTQSNIIINGARKETPKISPKVKEEPKDVKKEINEIKKYNNLSIQSQQPKSPSIMINSRSNIPTRAIPTYEPKNQNLIKDSGTKDLNKQYFIQANNDAYSSFSNNIRQKPIIDNSKVDNKLNKHYKTHTYDISKLENKNKNNMTINNRDKNYNNRSSGVMDKEGPRIYSATSYNPKASTNNHTTISINSTKRENKNEPNQYTLNSRRSFRKESNGSEYSTVRNNSRGNRSHYETESQNNGRMERLNNSPYMRREINNQTSSYRERRNQSNEKTNPINIMGYKKREVHETTNPKIYSYVPHPIYSTRTLDTKNNSANKIYISSFSTNKNTLKEKNIPMTDVKNRLFNSNQIHYISCVTEKSNDKKNDNINNNRVHRINEIREIKDFKEIKKLANKNINKEMKEVKMENKPIVHNALIYISKRNDKCEEKKKVMATDNKIQIKTSNYINKNNINSNLRSKPKVLQDEVEKRKVNVYVSSITPRTIEKKIIFDKEDKPVNKSIQFKENKIMDKKEYNKKDVNKKEDIKKEDIKKEDIKKEDIKKEVIKKEDIKKEVIKKEDIKKEDNNKNINKANIEEVKIEKKEDNNETKVTKDLDFNKNKTDFTIDNKLYNLDTQYSYLNDINLTEGITNEDKIYNKYKFLTNPELSDYAKEYMNSYILPSRAELSEDTKAYLNTVNGEISESKTELSNLTKAYLSLNGNEF